MTLTRRCTCGELPCGIHGNPQAQIQMLQNLLMVERARVTVLESELLIANIRLAGMMRHWQCARSEVERLADKLKGINK